MPYKDKRKQRENVKESVRRLREREALELMGNEDTFDVRAFLEQNKRQLGAALLKILQEKKVSVKGLELIVKILGLITEKKEETVKFELSTADRIRIARETLNGLREQYKQGSGVCSLCGRPQILCEEVCVGTEPELATGREVATVAVSVRPD